MSSFVLLFLNQCHISGSNGDVASEGSSAQPGEEHKPLVFSIKKEPPSYPSGDMDSLSADSYIVQYLGTITTCQGCHMAFPLCKNLFFFFLVFVAVHQGAKRSVGTCRSWPKAGSPVPNVKVWAERRWRGWRSTWRTADWWAPSSSSWKACAGKTVACVGRLSSVFGQQPFTCQHCGKQLKSSTGMKYHIMADHSQLVRALGPARFFPVWHVIAVCTIPRRRSLFPHCSPHRTTPKIWTTESSRTNCARFWRGWAN